MLKLDNPNPNPKRRGIQTTNDPTIINQAINLVQQTREDLSIQPELACCGDLASVSTAAV
jgi:hypothetical protein